MLSCFLKCIENTEIKKPKDSKDKLKIMLLSKCTVYDNQKIEIYQKIRIKHIVEY